MFKKVLDYIEVGKQGGAKCIAGGSRHGSKGFYIQPTVFADVKDDMRIAREEVAIAKHIANWELDPSSITYLY